MADKVNLQHEMIRILREEYGFRRSDARAAYRALLIALMDNLMEGVAVDIRGFGKFYISTRNPQQIKNRFTTDKPDGVAHVGPRQSLRFAPSKVVKAVLNNEKEIIK